MEKALAGEGLLAHVVVSKYVDHLPLHRLEGILARHGVTLARTTLCGWVADVATALAPIGDQLRRDVTAADYLQTDDTPVTVFDPEIGSFKGRWWTYLDPLGRQVVFDATPTHERDGPLAFLRDFRGQLQADAYAGYDGLYAGGRVIELACWAHARRRFVEALITDPQAAPVVALIQQLYRVERQGVDLEATARGRLRREQAVPTRRQHGAGARRELDAEGLVRWRRAFLPPHHRRRTTRRFLWLRYSNTDSDSRATAPVTISAEERPAHVTTGSYIRPRSYMCPRARPDP